MSLAPEHDERRPLGREWPHTFVWSSNTPYFEEIVATLTLCSFVVDLPTKDFLNMKVVVRSFLTSYGHVMGVLAGEYWCTGGEEAVMI